MERAQAFCRAQGGRLPTDLEWEYTARAGSRTPWPAGYDSQVLRDHEQVGGLGRNEVAELPPNAWGLYDMLGNAVEWVADIYVAGAYRRFAEAPQPLVDSPWFGTLDPNTHVNRTYKMGISNSGPWPSRRMGASSRANSITALGFRCVQAPEREVWVAE